MESTANWAKSTGKNFDELIASVTSKGGTTERVHGFWKENNLHQLMIDGLNEAKKME
jgi:pyrroline-5-carboxylate reductase